MNWLLSLAIFVMVEGGLPPEVVKALSLRCLLDDTFNHPCEVLPETSYTNLTTTFSPKFLDELANLDADFFKGVRKQNFSMFNQDVSGRISDSMYLFLPTNHLSRINRNLLINLMVQRSDSKVIKQFVKAYAFGNDLDYLNHKLQKMEFHPKSLKWIADVISSVRIISSEPLLIYAPPYTIPINRTDEKLFYLSLWERSDAINRLMPKPSPRFWIYALTRNYFPGTLDTWNDICFARFGVMLPAAPTYELIAIKKAPITNIQRLFDLKFSPIQVRALFDEFADRLLAGKVYNFTSSRILALLLPNQLLHFSEKISYLEQLQVLPSFKSLATSKQIYELMLFKKSKVGGYYPYINDFLYVWPSKHLSQFGKKSLRELIEAQSTYLSKNQLYILSSGSWPFHFNSEAIFDCTVFAKILPTIDIIINRTASHKLMHLLANIDAGNVPQSFAVMNQLWSVIGLPNTFKKILSNRDSDMLLGYIPSRHIARFAKDITLLAEKGNVLIRLPDSVVSSLLQQFKAADDYFNLLDVIEPLSFLFDGITCDDVNSLDPFDFVSFMIRYNERRKEAGKDFPKILQQCCVEKLLAYVELKSTIFQRYIGESKLSLLNEAEIDSIGGYIFAALPIKPIATAKYYKKIIKSIGELPLRELIISADAPKLEAFAFLLISDALRTTGKIENSIYDLGNLIFFLEKKNIFQLNRTSFKLMLESRYIDRRICTDKATRTVWFYYIRTIFGEPSDWTYQTLVTLGDLLLVVPASDLEKIPPKSWIYAADVLNTRYFDKIKLYHSSLKFYEVCMLHLNYDEADLYSRELARLIEKYVEAAQLQLDTVTPTDSIRKKTVENEYVFTYLESKNFKLKFFIPSVNNVIDTEKSMKNNKIPVQTTEQGIENKGQYSNYDSEFHSTTEADGFINNNKHGMVETPNGNNSILNISISPDEANIKKETSEQNDISAMEIYNSNFSFNENDSKVIQDVSATTASEVVEANYSASNEIYNSTESNTLNILIEKFDSPTTPSYTRIDLILSSNLKETTETRPTTEEDRLNIDQSVPEVTKELFPQKGGSDIIYNNHEIKNKTVYKVSNENFTVEQRNNAMIENLSISTNNENRLTMTELPTKPSYSDVTDLDALPAEKTTKPTIRYETKFEGEHSSTEANEDIPVSIKNHLKIERLLKNDNAKTELINLNFSFINSKLKQIKPLEIGLDTRERYKRSLKKWTCDALKVVGKPVEIILTRNVIESMSEEDINECLELFSDMDLSKDAKNAIWSKMNPELSFISGKITSAITFSDVAYKNFNISKRGAIENIYLTGRYSSDTKVRQHIINEVLKTRSLRFSVEILVTLGSLICELPEINLQIIEPSEFLKASVILGRNLPCNHSCLTSLSNIAVHKEAFKNPSKWTAQDVSNLGIVVAGLEQENWKKLISSDKNSLLGLSETTFNCLQPQHVKELEKVLQGNLNDKDPFNMLITYNFFGPPPRNDLIRPSKPSSSVQLIYFYIGFNLQLFISLFTTFFSYYIIL